MLDCTLRDGAYIVDSKFGTSSIKGIIKKMQDANINIIECGWLKNMPHQKGTTFYHVPEDLEQYIFEKRSDCVYTVMIDWDRYNLLENLTQYNGKSVDAIRIVFPKKKLSEAIPLGKIVKDKGYRLFFQAANTKEYSDEELLRLADEINTAKPEALSVVDTFGAMYWSDLDRITSILDEHLDKDIKLGFHSHNNQQLSFALSIQFAEKFKNRQRDIIIDSSLCGMGRGAGNTTTELMANYLNDKCQCHYDINAIMDAIDMYMGYFLSNYKWGYSTPYLISGMYCAHVNNIAYLTTNHRTNARDMKIIIESLSESERTKYDYDLLEQRFLDYQNKNINDDETIEKLKEITKNREILMLAPGTSILKEKSKIKKYISENKPLVIGVNAICTEYSDDYDYLFFSNRIRYEYAQEAYSEIFEKTDKIVLSSVKKHSTDCIDVVNFSLLVKRGWKHFDNAVIMLFRLLDRLRIKNVAIAGFDGFSDKYSESYSDDHLPSLNDSGNWKSLNCEIREIYHDFRDSTAETMNIRFLTESIYE